ncbi:MAG: UvrB/UvrC motif-containing protein [Phycisphaerae bacterium]|nr:UvrB/UvrC motif-containing protein [Phycisphaerae bacterium]MBN8598382.1 UvrB/UvrC motif-containing protein [Planctomycetota bacterium]
MKCESCDNEATVHDTLLREGAWVEVHFCEACAAKQGIAQPGASLNDLLTNFVLPQIAGEAAKRPKPAKARTPVCAECGFTFEQFRQAGLFGCPSCYTAFESLLLPLLERAHEGAMQHVGKVPKRITEAASGKESVNGARALAERRERLEREKLLRRQLDDAVKSEQYELAAKFRDQLQRLLDSSRAADPSRNA